MDATLPFQLLEEVGRGGMGVVFAARQPSCPHALAVKVLRSDTETSTRRFEAEAALHARLDHPHVVGLFDYGRLPEPVGELPAGSPFLVMEGATGTLGGVASRKEMTWARVQVVVDVLCEALAYLHARLVVHCDLKPSNVLVGCSRLGPATLFRQGLRLADFGVSRWGRAVPLGSGYTTGFAAPEQRTRRLWAQGPWTDTYALARVVERLVEADPSRGIPGVPVPSDLAGWLAHALDPHWAQRFESAPQMLEAFRGLGPPGVAPSVTASTDADTRFTEVAPAMHAGTTSASEKRRSIPPPPPLPPHWEVVPLGCPLPQIPGLGRGLSALRSVPLQGFEVERGMLWDGLLCAAQEERPRWIGVQGTPRRCAELLRGFAHRARASAVLVFDCAPEGLAWLHAIERALFPMDRPRQGVWRAVDERLEPFRAVPLWAVEDLARAIENRSELSAEAVLALLQGCAARSPVVVLGHARSRPMLALKEQLQGAVLVVEDGAPGIELTAEARDRTAVQRQDVTEAALPEEDEARRWLARLSVRHPEDPAPSLDHLPRRLLDEGWIAIRHREVTLMREVDLIGKLTEEERRHAHAFWVSTASADTLSRAFHLAGAGQREAAVAGLIHQVFPLMHAGRFRELGHVSDMLENLARTPTEFAWSRGARTLVDRWVGRFDPEILEMSQSHPLFPWIVEAGASAAQFEGDLPAALSLSQKALTAAERHEDVAATHEAMAAHVAAVLGGGTAEADAQARALLTRYLSQVHLPTGGAARLWKMRGNVNMMEGDAEGSRKALEEAWRVAEACGHHHRIAMACQSLAQCEEEPEAQTWLLARGLHAARISGVEESISMVSFRYGHILLRRGRLQEAEGLLHRASAGIPSASWTGLAMLYAEQGRWDLVSHAYERLREDPCTLSLQSQTLLRSVHPASPDELASLLVADVQAPLRELAVRLLPRIEHLHGTAFRDAFEQAHVMP